MSKRKQTENLHLYAYELTNGLPTFLKDWSDNMAILDGAHASVLSLIGALDERLTTAEGTLEDLSPESIQDYKIRLDALEKKVVINTNGIKDVNTKIATVNAQINTINAEQIVQDNRLTAIEGLGTNHTELINALRTDLTGVDGRVTTLEQCCENVQHEITDMQHDIDGFNDDVTALGTQVETLSSAVSELTELVNSLQLDVVSQRLDSFEASLTELTSRVATAESNITAQGNALEEHNTRITANANNIEDIDTEIGDTDYSEIGDSVSASLVELAERIRALTPQEYDVLISRLNTVETEVSDIEGAVDNLDSSVSALQTSVTSKADESDLLIVQGDVSALQTSVASKASASDVTTLQSDVSTLQTSVASKANASDVTMLQSDVNTLQNDVSTLQTNVASKASASDVTALSTKVSNSLDVTDPTEGAGVIKFGVDANGNYGYKKVGADTVTPFKSTSELSLYGLIDVVNRETLSINCSNLFFISGSTYGTWVRITCTAGMYLLILSYSGGDNNNTMSDTIINSIKITLNSVDVMTIQKIILKTPRIVILEVLMDNINNAQCRFEINSVAYHPLQDGLVLIEMT